jgi:hypothetical protein
MDVDREPLVGLRLLVEAIEEDRVRAHDDVLLPRDDPVDELDDLRVDGRLAAADRHDGRAALVDRGEALRERQPVAEVARVALGEQPMQARLQVWSGSSMSTTGTRRFPAHQFFACHFIMSVAMCSGNRIEPPAPSVGDRGCRLRPPTSASIPARERQP